MKAFLYWIVGLIARIHDRIGGLNDSWTIGLSDKGLHFFVIGLLGMGMFFVINPLFRYLARKKMESAITWVYVMTVTIVITFAIEIGQKVTGTGNMEFADIVFGILGFIMFFALYAIVKYMIWGIKRIIRRTKRKKPVIEHGRKN